MEILLLSARVLLALIFAVAGAAKAADYEGSRQAMISFRVPDALAGFLGVTLAVVEMAIAISLLPLSTAWFGAVAGGALLLVFIGAISVQLASGRTANCHCFGQLHSEPVGGSTIARNIVLFGIASFVVLRGRNNAGLSALNWLGDLKAGEIVGLSIGAISVALLATVFVNVRRLLEQNSALIDKIEAMKAVIDEDYAEAPVERADAALPVEGLPVGAPAPEFAVKSLDGATVSLEDLLARQKPVLLLFVSPNCAPCKTLLGQVEGWEKDYGKALTIALLSKGTPNENERLVADRDLRYFLLQGELNIAERYQSQWTPAAILISSEGRIASKITYGDDAIREFVERVGKPAEVGKNRVLAIKSNGNQSQVTINTARDLDNLGNRAPDFAAPNMRGDIVDLESLKGRDTLLLFWDPKCPYCREMVDDLISCEKAPSKKAPRLVFISSGSEADAKAESERFESEFLHDPEFDIGVSFGTNRTPSAVLIDKSGRIASAPTGGRVNILLLAGMTKSEIPEISPV